jgi:pyruvate/2-oxoglutarate dehydrogenase complex dihydrolipoamide dehydrogenase (E3) component
MSQAMTVDVCIIGAGAAGLVSASGAAQLGLKTVLIEANAMGGECLNSGCVPSKAILSAAHAARQAAGMPAMGIHTDGAVKVDFQAVMEHVRSAIRAIEPHDSQDRFEGLGATVIRDWARFTGPRTIVVGDQTIYFKKAVIATGSSPMVPPIDGIDEVDFLTNETLWSLAGLPEHLLIIGGGAIGCEMSQAFALLGAKVSLFEMGTVLGRVDPDAAQLVREQFASDGIDVHEKTSVTQLKKQPDGRIGLTYEKDGQRGDVVGTHLLVAAGRTVKTDHLDLEAAGVERSRRGITVDKRLRTSNKRIYAVGDCNGEYQLTHAAGHEAGQFIKSALFKIPTGITRAGMVHVTYTQPEVAQAGMTEAQAREAYSDEIEVLSAGYDHNDRAIAEGKTSGTAKLILSKKGQVLGASITGAHAGELIHLWSLAIAKGLKPRDLSSYIAPYPTFSEVNKALVGAYFQDRLFAPKTRYLVRFLNAFG